MHQVSRRAASRHEHAAASRESRFDLASVGQLLGAMSAATLILAILGHWLVRQLSRGHAWIGAAVAVVLGLVTAVYLLVDFLRFQRRNVAAGRRDVTAREVEESVA